MIQRLRLWGPSIALWAMGVLSAYLGARFSSNQAVTGGVWAACGIGLLIASLNLYINTRAHARRELDLVEQEVSEDRRALAVGRRAMSARFLAIERDGGVLTCTVADLLEANPPHGMHSWENPYWIRVYHAGAVAGTGDQDGEPA